ncbi:MAG: hypothetical protein WAK13_20000 [Terriglobales bacterium]
MVLDARCEEFLTFSGPLLTGISLYPNDAAIKTAIRKPAYGGVPEVATGGKPLLIRYIPSRRDPHHSD